MVNYINEASIKDADKLSYKGNEVRTTRKGADIANAIRERNRYNDLIEDGYDVKKPNLPIDIDKNKPIEADRKRDIKASTRNKNHVVPDVGANPSYSKDADTKAVQRFKEALKNKDIDINKITLDSRLEEDLGLSSVALIYFAVMIEEQFDISLEDEKLSNFKTINDVINCIIKKA